MSVPNNSLTIKEWWVYAEHLAANNTAINHVPGTHVAFVRSSFPELQGADFQELQSPALIAEAPDSTGIDNNSNNLLVQRFLAWTIAKRIDVQEATYAQRIDAELECETIALKVLGRLRRERIHMNGQVFADVKMSEWEGEPISPFLPAGWVGYRIMVPVQVNDKRLIYDAADWNDPIGSVIYRDLTGISCANLNHPTLGLTQAQRLNCILPGYDFLDDATFDALTDEQIAQLASLFGSSDMEYIKQAYISEADALADNVTTPAATQAIKVAGRLYQGDGTSTSRALVLAKVFNPSVTEDPATGLHTTFDGADALIQLNAP